MRAGAAASAIAARLYFRILLLLLCSMACLQAFQRMTVSLTQNLASRRLCRAPPIDFAVSSFMSFSSQCLLPPHSKLLVSRIWMGTYAAPPPLISLFVPNSRLDCVACHDTTETVADLAKTIWQQFQFELGTSSVAIGRPCVVRPQDATRYFHSLERCSVMT